MLKISFGNNRHSSLSTAAALGLFLFSSIPTLSHAADLGSVSVLGDIKPANPTAQQVWNAHWGQAYDNCKRQFSNSHSVVLASWDVTAGGKFTDHWQINSVWWCRS